jgi:hypothetical protein
MLHVRSGRRGGLSTTLALASTVAVISMVVGGCAAETNDDEATSESALSSTRVRVVPLDDASRVACRAVAEKVYCSESAAETARRGCSPSGKNGRTKLEAKTASCSSTQLAYPTVASCAVPLDTDCTYYSACLEKAIPCGNEGYALGFGEKFCTAFRGAELSASGTKWMKTVMGCLQRVLAPEVVAKGKFTTEAAPRAVCQDLFDRAFASHPACYTSDESSICFLPPGDLATVLQTIGAQEILKPRTGVQVVSTVGICVKQLTGRLFGFGSKKSGSGTSFANDQGARERAQEAADDLSREELEALLATWKDLENQGY